MMTGAFTENAALSLLCPSPSKLVINYSTLEEAKVKVSARKGMCAMRA